MLLVKARGEEEEEEIARIWGRERERERERRISRRRDKPESEPLPPKICDWSWGCWLRRRYGLYVRVQFSTATENPKERKSKNMLTFRWTGVCN